MSPSTVNLIYECCNQLVWIAFVFLAWQAGMAVFESKSRQRIYAKMAREVLRLRQQVEIFLKPGPNDASLSKRECQKLVLKDVRSLWNRINNPELAKVLPGLLEATLAGRDDCAMDLNDRFLLNHDGRISTQLTFKELCIQNGLMGTVLGLLQLFSSGDVKTVSLSAIGFALLTTAAGLFLAACFSIALTLIFEPAFHSLSHELEETRSHWARLWRERTQWMRDDSAELLAIAEVIQEVRATRKSGDDISSALCEVLAGLPEQLAKELLKFAEAPSSLFSDATTNVFALDDLLPSRRDEEFEM